jgi:hypothetical protein
MIENKRFTTRNIINSSYCVWDNDGKEYGNDEVVELLNGLHEKYIDEYTLRETLQLELQRVEEENKELKKQVNDLQFNKSIGQREYQRRLSE